MKKVLKKSLALLLCMLMAMSAVVSAFAAETVSGICKNNRWEYNGSGRLTIYPYEADVTYSDVDYYVDDEGNTIYYDNCYYDADIEKFVIIDYSYDSILDEIDPEMIQEIVIAEGVESLDITELVLCTEVQKVSIPASLNFGMEIDPEDLPQEVNALVDSFIEEIGLENNLAIDLRAVVYAIIETIGYEECIEMTLPLSAKQFTVANGNTIFKAVNGKLYTADGKVLLRQSADVKQLMFDVDPFIDPIALCGITGADVTITDAYANAFYGAKSQIVSLLDQLKAVLEENMPEDPDPELDLEFSLFEDLLNNAAPAVDEVIDLIFTLEMSLFSAKSFTVSDSNAYLKTVDGVLYNKDMTALIKYPVACGENAYTMPASVTKYSLPFLAIDPVAAIRCAYKVYGFVEMGELNIDAKEELSNVILIPSVTVNANGRNLNAYFEGSSQIETLFYNALNTFLDYYAAEGGLEEQLGQDLVTSLKSLSNSALKIALGIVKMIGTSKVVLNAVSDQFENGISIYNGVIQALHALTETARAVAKGSKRDARKALSDFLKGELFVQLLGEDTANGLYDLVDAIFDSDYTMFIESLYAVVADLADVASKLIQKYELQQTVAMVADIEPERIDAILALTPEGTAFLRDPSFSNWKALCVAANNIGFLDEEIYAEAITEEYYEDLMATINEELNDLFSQASAGVSYVFANMTSSEFAMYAVLINVIADAVDAVVDLFPQEIVVQPHTHIFGDWERNELTDSGYARTCTICGLVDPFVVPEEPEKVLSGSEDSVVIEGSNEAIESGVTLKTERISKSVESENYVEEWFMVKLMKGGVEVQPKAPIVLKLEYPNWVKNPENLQLWHYTNGDWVRMNTWLEDPNYICCVTDSLSPFKWTEEVEEPEHVLGDAVEENVVPATCTEAGSYEKVYYCTICGMEFSREKVVTDPATGHSYNAVTTAPTYTQEGYTTYTCSRCGDTYKDNSVPALAKPVVQLEKDSLSMTYKTESKLSANIENKDNVSVRVTWTSSNEKVAKVDQDGKVTATGRGDATITCTLTDAAGNTFADSCKVTVKYTWWQWLIFICILGWIWY